ncbi:MAG TPA: alpha/beta fold hydrolase [Solirubrobacterales bacterium]|nr:alpha/beta fold hydrolase [Solirubrobacterales bacterium]
MPDSQTVMSGSVVFPASDYGNPDPEWLEIDWREHLHRIELPGAEVNYAEIGEGEPILFVHGLAGCWQNWLENLPHFGRTHRAIALDLPGFGASPMPSWTIDMPAYGRLIHDFCEKLGIDRVAALVGNSMGGFVSTEAVIERPSRFEQLVLVSAAGISFAEKQGRRDAALTAMFEATIPHLAGPRQTWLARPRGRQVAFGNIFNYPNRVRPELLQEQIDPSIRSPGFADSIRAIGGYDTRHRLTEIEVPTLVVWGLKDRIVPVEAAIGYHRLIPESRLELFERTGHVPQMERPARFNSLLDDFLAD